MKRTCTAQEGSTDPGGPVRRITSRVRAVVLGGLALAAVYTAAALVLDAGAEHIGPLWLIAIAWTFAASLAGGVWRGFRHRDWSAFSNCELPEDGGGFDEWTRTDPDSWPGDIEYQLLHHDDHLR